MEPGEALTYKWNGIEIKLHCVSALSESVHSVAICLTQEDNGTIKEIFSANPNSNLAVIGVRENSGKFELACCHHSDLSFGPLFFEAPVKGKFIQALVTSKILHAFRGLPSHKERRFEAFKEHLLDCIK